MNHLKSNFLKTLCFVAAVSFAPRAQGQSIAQVDLIAAAKVLPPPPTSVADALSKADCSRGNCKADALFKDFDAIVAAAEKQWSVMNAGTKAQMDSGIKTANIMKSAVGSNVSMTQKLETAKQLPGANTSVMSFAQQMQDPAFKAKFAAMSQQDKMAYIQSSGMMSQKPAPPPPPAPDPAAAALAALSDTTYVHLKALMPTTDSFLAIIADTNFIFGDSASEARMQNSLTPTVDSMANILSAIISNGDSGIMKATAAHDKQLKSIVKSKKLNSISDQPAYHAIKMKALDEEVAEENASIGNFDKLWKDAVKKVNEAVEQYNKAIIASNYGATLTTPADQQLITGISQTQVRALLTLDHYAEVLKSVYAELANLATKEQSVDAEKVTPYSENKTGE
jgi:hypothetical protein